MYSHDSRCVRQVGWTWGGTGMGMGSKYLGSVFVVRASLFLFFLLVFLVFLFLRGGGGGFLVFLPVVGMMSGIV